MTSTTTVFEPTGPEADEAMASVVSRRLVAAGISRETQATTRVRGYRRIVSEGFRCRENMGKGWAVVTQVSPEDKDRAVEVLRGHGYRVAVTPDSFGMFTLRVAGRYASPLD